MGDGDIDLACSMAILGECNVGKSYLIQRLNNEMWGHIMEKQTIGVDSTSCVIPLKCPYETPNRTAQITTQIYDFSGHARFENLNKHYIPHMPIIVLMYDCQDPKSFEQMEKWRKYVLDNVKWNYVLFALIAGKADKNAEIKVPHDTGKKLAQDNKWLFFTVSSRDSSYEDIRNVFSTILTVAWAIWYKHTYKSNDIWALFRPTPHVIYKYIS